MENKRDQLNLIGIKEFNKYDDMYKVVDFLNKSLKTYGIIFGLSLKNDKDVISIYKTLDIDIDLDENK